MRKKESSMENKCNGKKDYKEEGKTKENRLFVIRIEVAVAAIEGRWR
jgi:hypothetical protein